MSEEVLLQRDAPISGVCTITLNRPSRGNALTSVMLDLLLGYLKALEDDVGVFAVVLTGSGKFFCTGMDLSGNGGAGIGKAPENVFSALARFAKPLFARVNGPCLGGGVGILFCCDIRLALSSCYIQFSEVLRGLVPALISAVIVPQLGLFKSRQYMMTGEKVSASQLFSDGQLSSVFADMPSLDAALLSVCRNQLLCAPGAVRLVKRAVFDVHSSPDSESQRQQLVRALFATMMASPEAAHGMAAFMAKRDPEWPAFAKAKL